ncbi:MAG: DNA alkylation repair protein [bacterium]
MTYLEVIKKIRSMANKKNVEGMARFGINSKNTLGVPMGRLRELAKKLKNEHTLALKLWASGIHEAKILASIIDDPEKVTEKQMDLWVKDFDSWDVCDQTCMNLFGNTKYAYKKVYAWAKRKEEFVRRASFAMIAVLAWHDEKAENEVFVKMLPLIKKYATDERNFVRKAVNWALRHIGKRNMALNKEALKTAKEMEKQASKTERWIAKDAIRELTSPKIQARVKLKTQQAYERGLK